MLRSWPAPHGGEEFAITFNKQRGPLLLVLPAWFDEGNKTRHFTVETMRALDRLDVDSVLPDLPGCNESMVPMAAQDLVSWREAATSAAWHFGATHVLTIRAGANVAPALPGWGYAPLAGRSALRALLRARIIAAKEAGRAEDREALLQLGMREGLELAGYHLGAEMVAGLAEAELPERDDLAPIAQGELGGAGLWLRMEPDHEPAQAEALARRIASEIRP